MIATFVIGLREGLEAALIVGIIAGFLQRQGRPELLRMVWWGVGAAVGLCTAAAVALQLVSANLPQAEQEGLETVVGVAAVIMVTSMIVWMQQHARALRGQLEGAAAAALATGSSWALVAMAFLAVLREGLETAVFLLATFQASDNAALMSAGALAGILTAVAAGYGIARGTVRINLARFFRLTSLLLVAVAAGLVMTSLHTAHEAGWLTWGQARLLDLSGLVQPGSVQSAVLTGVLGLQSRPTQIEVAGWLLYIIPASLFVLWPRRAFAGRAAGSSAPQDTRPEKGLA